MFVQLTASFSSSVNFFPKARPTALCVWTTSIPSECGIHERYTTGQPNSSWSLSELLQLSCLLQLLAVGTCEGAEKPLSMLTVALLSGRCGPVTVWAIDHVYPHPSSFCSLPYLTSFSSSSSAVPSSLFSFSSLETLLLRYWRRGGILGVVI